MLFCLDPSSILCYTNLDNKELNASEDPVLRSENLSSEISSDSDSESDSENFLNDFNDLRSELVVVSEHSETYDLYSV